MFLIPDEDARRVIRAATRSAYAEACQLEHLALANYQAMMQSEIAKKVWSEQQLLMINALHKFSSSYFSGDAKITEVPDEGVLRPPKAKTQPSQGADLVAPKRPQCPPEQKQKVENAINAYVQSAQAPASPSPRRRPRRHRRFPAPIDTFQHSRVTEHGRSLGLPGLRGRWRRSRRSVAFTSKGFHEQARRDEPAKRLI